MSKKRFFGTDGVRGRVGENPITIESMLQLGYAFGTVLLSKYNNPVVIIGRDTRVSGSGLQSALQAGLSAVGVGVQDVGVLPTPAVAYLTVNRSAQAGIVISASHNPYFDNGVKFFNDKGMKLTNEMELQIERQWLNTSSMKCSDTYASVRYCANARDEYVTYCASTWNEQVNLGDIRVVVDAANGAAADVAPAVFSAIGGDDFQYMSSSPDGFNINQNCGATDVSALQQHVLQSGADCGIAFDGDGDRLIMVDHLGEVADGDQLLCIMAFAADRNVLPGVVGTIMSNLGLEQALQSAGIPFVRAKVGDRYVLSECQQRDWFLGGESSGHIIDLNNGTTGDALMAALQVLLIIRSSGKSLYELKQQMVKHPQILLNVPVDRVITLSDHPLLLADIAEFEQRLAQRGRILVRPSGTEPCVRVMVEGFDLDEIRSLANELKVVVADRLNRKIVS
jgi:phosphoglucosamine mutase